MRLGFRWSFVVLTAIAVGPHATASSPQDPPVQQVDKAVEEPFPRARAFDATGQEIENALTVTARSPASATRLAAIAILAVPREPVPAIAKVVVELPPISLGSPDAPTRVLRFDRAPASPSRVVTLGSRVESDTLLVAARSDGTSAYVIAAYGPYAERATIGLTAAAASAAVAVGADASIVATIEIAVRALPTPVSDAVEIAACSFGGAPDAMTAIESLDLYARAPAPPGDGAPRALADVRADARTPGFVLTRKEGPAMGPLPPPILRCPVAGRPLDLFDSEGDGAPGMWLASAADGAVRILLLDPADEPRTFAVATRDLFASPPPMVAVTDAETSDLVGHCRDGFVIPVARRSRRLLDVRAAAADVKADAPQCEIVAPEKPVDRGAVEVVDVNAADLESGVLSALGRNGVVFVHLGGEQCLDPVPPAIARHIVPQVVPYRATKRSVAPRGAAERLSKLAANVEWTMGFPTQGVDAREWLVSLESGFLATPLQPRVVDGMPAARGFVVFMNPGLLVITRGFSPQERESIANTLCDPQARNDAFGKTVAAQQAVRLAADPVGLFAAFARFPRWREPDLVPGDPLVMDRWAANVVGESRRRLRSLPITPGGDAVTEDVLEFSGVVNFALDLPRPFVEPLIVVLRRPGDSRVALTYQATPIERLIDGGTDPRSWAEDVLLLFPDRVTGQVRGAFSLEAEDGSAAVARVGFFHDDRADGVALAFVTPSGIAPGPASVGFGKRLDGRVITSEGAAHYDGMELATGSKVTFPIAAEQKVQRFAATAIAPEDEPESGGGILIVRVDGAERSRIDLRPGLPEPLRWKLDIPSARSIEFEVLPRGTSPGRVLLLGPRVR